MIVYTLPNCMACKMTKTKLDTLGAEYEVREFDEAAIKLARSKDIISAPLVVVGDLAWGGYSPDRLKEYAIV